MVSLHKAFRLPGEPVQNLSMFARAWDECVELQTNPKDIWMGRSLLGLQGLARWELALFNYDQIMGGVVIAQEAWDPHVGQCASVFAQYVLPEYRLQGVSPRLMREAIRIAKDTGAQTMAFTHRKGPWRYETIYRRIAHERPEH